MPRHILLAAMILRMAVPALVLAQAQPPEQPKPKPRPERVVLPPMVDEKYGSSAEIMALEPARLIAILQEPGASVYAKAKACQRLAVVGDKSAVPALAALLADPRLAHYARFGLEPIPDPSADDVLRDALRKLQGRLLVGVINSVGYRRDAKAVGALAKLLYDGDSEVAQAAAAALGRISGPQAAKTLQQELDRGKAPVRPAVAGAALVCAEGLLAQGQRKQALALYDALTRADLPTPVRDAATRQMAAAAARDAADQEAREGFRPLFNGRDLGGWDGDPRLWRVGDGVIVGSTEGVTLQSNSFLITRRSFGDFHLKAQVKLRNHNSGIQFRSEALPDWGVRGLQADMAENNHWGSVYDERGKRGILVNGWNGKAEKAVRANDWNDYEILCDGDFIQLRVNGVVTAELRDTARMSGVIALQLHRGPAMEAQFRNLRIKVLR